MKSKLLWVTDLHLVEPGSPWPLGIDPLRRFTAVLDELREHHADAERLVLIFMHHPPAAVGVPALDRLRLSDPDNAFFDLICSRWAPTQLLCGHLHHSVSGLWAGHPFAVMGSTHVPVAFDMESDRLSRIQAPPGYGVVLVDNDNVAVNAVPLAN